MSLALFVAFACAQFLSIALETLYDSNVEGVILVSCDYLSVRDKLHSKISHVWIDCNDPPGQTGKICQVQSDHLISGSLAAQELLRRGCKKPIIITGVHNTHRSNDRLNGFVAEFTAKGMDIPPGQVISLPGIKSHVTESQEMIRYLLTKGTNFDSVFAMNDGWAMGAYMGLTRAGIAVPENVKLVGFDGISPACTEVLNITSIQQNVTLLSQYACEMLLCLIERKTIAKNLVIVPTTVLPGQTT